MVLFSMFTISSISFLTSLCTLAQCLQCIPPPGAPPTFPDCRDLTNAIAFAARLPAENVQKSWGRNLPTTPDTVTLPRVYWLRNLGPTTCAVHVDVSAVDYFAVDEFKLHDVGVAAEMVVAVCLMRLSLIGFGYPGLGRHVYAKVVRIDDSFSELLRNSSVQSLQSSDMTNLLQTASVSSLVNNTSLDLQDE